MKSADELDRDSMNLPTAEELAPILLQLAGDDRFGTAMQVLLLLAAREENREDLAALLGLASGGNPRAGTTRMAELLRIVRSQGLAVRLGGRLSGRDLHFYTPADRGRCLASSAVQLVRHEMVAPSTPSVRSHRDVAARDSALRMALALDARDAEAVRQLLNDTASQRWICYDLRTDWENERTPSAIMPTGSWIRAINDSWRNHLVTDPAFQVAYLATILLGRSHLRLIPNRILIGLVMHGRLGLADAEPVIHCVRSSFLQHVTAMESDDLLARQGGRPATWTLTALGGMKAELLLDEIRELRATVEREGVGALRAKVLPRRSVQFCDQDSTLDEQDDFESMEQPQRGRYYDLANLVGEDRAACMLGDVQLDPRYFSPEELEEWRERMRKGLQASAQALSSEVRALAPGRETRSDDVRAP